MSDIHGVVWECPKCHQYHLRWDGRARLLCCLNDGDRTVQGCGHTVQVEGAGVRPFVDPTSAQVREALYGNHETEEDKEEELGMEMHEIADEFWVAFSKLCNDTLDKRSDQSRRHELEMSMGDKTSIYGRDTEIRSGDKT